MPPAGAIGIKVIVPDWIDKSVAPELARSEKYMFVVLTVWGIIFVLLDLLMLSWLKWVSDTAWRLDCYMCVLWWNSLLSSCRYMSCRNMM